MAAERERLNTDVEFKLAEDEENSVEGFASVFKLDGQDYVDDGLDVVMPGAFKRSIKERVSIGDIPLLDSHQWNAASTLGTVTYAEEKEGFLRGSKVNGLWVRIKLSSAASAQEVKTKMIEGHIKKLSVAFQTITQTFKEHVIEEQKTLVRYISELKWKELSVVPLAENDIALITGVKSLLPYADLKVTKKEGGSSNALERVWERFGHNTGRLRQAFLIHNKALGDSKEAYRLQVADVNEKGKLEVVPSLLLSAATQAVGEFGIDGGGYRGEKVRKNLSLYFSKAGIKPPWEDGEFIITSTGIKAKESDDEETEDNLDATARPSTGVDFFREAEIRRQLAERI